MNGYFENMDVHDIDALASYMQVGLQQVIHDNKKFTGEDPKDMWLNTYFITHPQDVYMFIHEVIQGLGENVFDVSFPPEVIEYFCGKDVTEIPEKDIDLIHTAIYDDDKLHDMIFSEDGDMDENEAERKVTLLETLEPMIAKYGFFLDQFVRYAAFNAKSIEDLEDCIEACDLLIRNPRTRLDLFQDVIPKQIIRILDPAKRTANIMKKLKSSEMIACAQDVQETYHPDDLK